MPRKKKSTKPATLRGLAAEKADLGFYGPEPEYVAGIVLDDRQLRRALNWYTNMNLKDTEQYLADYLIRNNCENEAKIVIKDKDGYFAPTHHFIARILNQGGVVDKGVYIRFHDAVKKGVAKYLSDNPERVVVTKTIQQRTKDKLGQIIAFVEDQIDTRNEQFSLYQWLSDEGIGGVYGANVSEYYRPLLEELNSTDPEVKAAYKWMKLQQFTTYKKIIEQIITDGERFTDNKKNAAPKTPRATRVKKPQPIEVKLAKFKYAKENSELKLMSIDPKYVIGKTSLWIFDPRSNKITVLRSSTGLDIKGTSIIGFDPKQSKAKKAGKHLQRAKLLENILTTSKIPLKKIFDDLSAAETAVSGQTSDSTILLKVEK